MLNDGLFSKLRGELAIFQGNLFARVSHLANEAISNGLEVKLDVETVVATALAAFDKYIVPYDIPKIPEIIEVKLEAAARVGLEYIIRQAYSMIS